MDKNNPIRCSEPFASPDAANAAVEAFLKDFEAIRLKHRIPNAYVIVGGMVINPDGNEVPFSTSGGLGRQIEWITMIARAMGQEEAELRQHLNFLRSGRKE